jgi:hypothetical protein
MGAVHAVISGSIWGANLEESTVLPSKQRAFLQLSFKPLLLAGSGIPSTTAFHQTEGVNMCRGNSIPATAPDPQIA